MGAGTHAERSRCLDAWVRAPTLRTLFQQAARSLCVEHDPPWTDLFRDRTNRVVPGTTTPFDSSNTWGCGLPAGNPLSKWGECEHPRETIDMSGALSNFD